MTCYLGAAQISWRRCSMINRCSSSYWQ